MPRRPPNRTGPANLSDRNRKALASLRELWAQPPTLTEEETEAWIREIRLMREESTERMLEQFQGAAEKPVEPTAGGGPAPEPPQP